jgi:hypothetical protein
MGNVKKKPGNRKLLGALYPRWSDKRPTTLAPGICSAGWLKSGTRLSIVLSKS